MYRSMSRIPALACLATALFASACATMPRPQPVDVIRYHLDGTNERSTVALVTPDGPTGPEYQLEADAVMRQLDALGFGPAHDAARSAFVVSVGFKRTPQGAIHERPPVSIGVGGGSWSPGGGVGAGVTMPVGHGHRRAVTLSELGVQIRRRSDNTVYWEGHAQTQTIAGQPADQPGTVADRLAYALFKGFPGESGITITVK